MRWRAALAWLLAGAVLLLAACTSTPEASRERDAEAKEFTSHPGFAAIYVYRTDTVAGNMSDSHSVLWVDSRLIGSTLPLSYFRVDVRPGRYLLHGDGPDIGRLQLDVHSGEVYFVRLNVSNANSRFTPVAADAARKEILRCCGLLENWAPGQRPLLR